MSAEIKVTLKRGLATANQNQQENLKGLGLKKTRQQRVFKDTPEVRGMIRKVSHMVEVETV
ncbi:MAG: 50S ribosomal protein L30 [Candidatus Lambdaproteobacteria bacterium RIFOXYD12_FULL_49_8]|uniref:Large ribosomal subunit protein uL30 n=1 Tax=Candidatus Lambdaproteobacteria bacterium RIFOXYD2_FULL_50_16 TaxID=1817772 RepID=A0A1F6G6D8_9PROT|nr:MAG: 50S ribosomal protein L30 [Candidatus Lambdaproteobacteria bacterium RIFOXYD2_FULL_50_16]OGG96406.1 MAG: 50S ribosomal protein L30 [Candidatus Lambdaproteobacteria bacterium RIFOXYD12_FULL_49_8]